MALRHFNLTLDGSVQRLSSVFANPQPGGPDDAGLRFLTLQPAGGNTGPIYVGGTPQDPNTAVDVTATDYGIRLEAGSGGVPPAPLVLGEFNTGPMKLSEVYVFGTATDVLHISGWEF